VRVQDRVIGEVHRFHLSTEHFRELDPASFRWAFLPLLEGAGNHHHHVTLVALNQAHTSLRVFMIDARTHQVLWVRDFRPGLGSWWENLRQGRPQLQIIDPSFWAKAFIT